MAAIFNKIGEIEDALAHKTEKSPKAAFKLLGYTFAWISFINESALEKLGGVGEYFKAAKGATALWYPVDTFVKSNKLRHVVSSSFSGETNPVTGEITTPPKKVALAVLDLMIPLCDAVRVLGEFSVWNIDKVAPFFSSVSLRQVFGTLGGMSLAIRFTYRIKDDSLVTLGRINRDLETAGINPAAGPQTIPQLENERMKTYCEIAGRIALIAVGIILTTASITGVFYWPPILICGSFSLLTDFVVQYFKDRDVEFTNAAAALA